ncbi:hypothetical protein M427DRAFT_157912 [Gonapodya prolifera JEL478]|uniref:Atos-like conserved domain-containing protein n=1 Tax=Gonapodya prolifera (strain JEL478) TaxID=1344416 RepID=A0A139A540_GONPJ|nr:hypothetical protein M427DRAFT_157912 [Gonapodya prolifera JEL478]|eukprot:KXS11854.1 hypothetical protein M427DRAFT_157912 [Gonapodya prolifera JEL478]
MRGLPDSVDEGGEYLDRAMGGRGKRGGVSGRSGVGDAELQESTVDGPAQRERDAAESAATTSSDASRLLSTRQTTADAVARTAHAIIAARVGPPSSSSSSSSTSGTRTTSLSDHSTLLNTLRTTHYLSSNPAAPLSLDVFRLDSPGWLVERWLISVDASPVGLPGGRDGWSIEELCEAVDAVPRLRGEDDRTYCLSSHSGHIISPSTSSSQSSPFLPSLALTSPHTPPSFPHTASLAVHNFPPALIATSSSSHEREVPVQGQGQRAVVRLALVYDSSVLQVPGDLSQSRAHVDQELQSSSFVISHTDSIPPLNLPRVSTSQPPRPSPPRSSTTPPLPPTTTSTKPPAPTRRPSLSSALPPSLSKPPRPLLPTISSLRPALAILPIPTSSPPRSPIGPSATPASTSLGASGGGMWGPFVGSYEESLLSRRLPTPPSAPLPFLAILGSTSSHPSTPPRLRCTRQLPLPFDAVFWDLPGGEDEAGGGRGGKGWTPYVGTVDVEAGVGTKPSKSASKRVRGKGDVAVEDGEDQDADVGAREGLRSGQVQVQGYRLPERGQLQIIIKNPSRTAVKVFLLPYDFTSLPPSSRTFVRQKSYAVPGTSVSTRPATVVRPSAPSPSPPSSGTPEATTPCGTKKPRGPLRYALHLQIARDGKGRVFLWRTMRVVFSHGGEGGGEKLDVVVEEGASMPLNNPGTPPSPAPLAHLGRSFPSPSPFPTSAYASFAGRSVGGHTVSPESLAERLIGSSAASLGQTGAGLPLARRRSGLARGLARVPEVGDVGRSSGGEDADGEDEHEDGYVLRGRALEGGVKGASGKNGVPVLRVGSGSALSAALGGVGKARVRSAGGTGVDLMNSATGVAGLGGGLSVDGVEQAGDSDRNGVKAGAVDGVDEVVLGRGGSRKLRGRGDASSVEMWAGAR